MVGNLGMHIMQSARAFGLEFRLRLEMVVMMGWGGGMGSEESRAGGKGRRVKVREEKGIERG